MMWLLDLLKKGDDQTGQCKFTVDADVDGLVFSLPKEQYRQCATGDADNWALHQYLALKQLEEQGEAEAIANGFVLPSSAAVRLDAESRLLLGVAEPFDGSFMAKIHSVATRSDFSIDIVLQLKDGSEIVNPNTTGPYLKLSSTEKCLLRPAELLAFESLKQHKSRGSNNVELDNLELVAALQNAKSEGMLVDLAHFDSLGVVFPQSVRVAVTKMDDGSLALSPAFGNGVDQSMVDARLGQIDRSARGGTLRVGDHVVVLDEERIKATNEILSSRRISKSQVEEFFKFPTAFLDASLVNLEVGFSLRVRGAERFHFVPFGETDASRVNWFTAPTDLVTPEQLNCVVKDLGDLDSVEEIAAAANEGGADTASFDGYTIDVSDYPTFVEKCEQLRGRFESGSEDENDAEPDVEELVPERAVVSVDEVNVDTAALLAIAGGAKFTGKLDLSNCARTPYPHQEEGIRWAYGLAMKSQEKSAGDPNRISGALLADDMGLGKTYMGLLTFEHYLRHLSRDDRAQKPVLVVAPLSLLENWESEVGKTFQKSPFRDIVVLQAGKDLNKYRTRGASRETQQTFEDDEVLTEEAITYSLKVGPGHVERLDMDRRLVLTTYQTLRDYQFSLCRVDWSIVLFDEAQNVKNPNTLASHAAKGLKADFKLLATGTPVENSLADFYSIIDIAQPGLLGGVDEFRNRYIRPIRGATDDERDTVRQEVGKQLRADVGSFMLRRLKENELGALPPKRLFTGSPESKMAEYLIDLSGEMSGHQLDAYDQVLDDYRSDVTDNGGQGKALAALQKLKAISMHPLMIDSEVAQDADKSSINTLINESSKIKCAFEILNQIKSRNEKAIVFVISKKLQRYLKIWLSSVYGIEVDIINGDTQAVASKRNLISRQGYVDKFSTGAGFGVIIMSPVAAGTGLTVTAANNVIHLERHWNPAKEAQATDRVYRIGQEKEVNIYYPTALHPSRTSFDQNLDQLLMNKVSLSDAVVTPEVVRESDFSLFS